MLNRQVLNNEDFVQYGSYCVLASYAVALRPFIGTGTYSVRDFFVAYCGEMKLGCSTGALTLHIGAERLYLTDFTMRTKYGGITGYELLLAIHANSDVPLFREARRIAEVEHLRLPRDANAVEDMLRRDTRSAAIVFVNHRVTINLAGAVHEIAQNHSITIAFDNGGFYMHDVNRNGFAANQRTLDLGQNLELLGESECLLFLERLHVA